MRIEDLDAARCPQAAGERILEVLGKLGLNSDEPPLWQSQRTEIYEEKEAELKKSARIYPCFCTRAQLHSAEAPRLDDGSFFYSGACRHISKEEIAIGLLSHNPCYRMEVPDEVISFYDGVTGEYRQNLKTESGDFILRRSDGVFAYQLAVSIDDGESGVTEVVRGRDLLSSTPRQILILRKLNYSIPKYYHIPLVCDINARKLSKSEGDSAYKAVFDNPKEKVLGVLAYASGITDSLRPTSLEELTEIFSWENVKRDTIYLSNDLIL